MILSLISFEPGGMRPIWGLTKAKSLSNQPRYSTMQRLTLTSESVWTNLLLESCTNLPLESWTHELEAWTPILHPGASALAHRKRLSRFNT